MTDNSARDPFNTCPIESDQTVRSCSEENCSFDKTGHCAKHDVEVERRLNLTQELSSFRREVSSDISSLKQDMKAMMTTLGVHGRRLAYGAGVMALATLIILGAYAYTTSTKLDSKEERLALKEDQLRISEDVKSLLISMGKTETQVNNAMKAMTDYALAMKELSAIQHEHTLKSTRDHAEWRSIRKHLGLEDEDSIPELILEGDH